MQRSSAAKRSAAPTTACAVARGILRPERRHELEQAARLAADVRPRRDRRGDADTEDRAPARVVGRRVVRPSAVEPHPEPEPAVALVGLHEERQPALRQLLGIRFRRSDGDREAPPGVVGAVAERTMRQRADRMLEQTGVVGHALQVSERWLRQGHAAASRSANTRCASRRYSLADGRPCEPLGLELRLASHRSGQRVVGEQAAERLRDRLGILVRHHDAAGRDQLFDRMREGGRDDGLARRDGLDEDAGADLLTGLVRQQHDVGAADQRAQGGRVEVSILEYHAIRDTLLRRQPAQTVPISLALPEEHLGVRLSGDHVDRRGVEVAQIRHGFDAVLQALAGPDQSPGQDDGFGAMDDARPLDVGRGSVRDDGDVIGRDVVDRDQPAPGGVGHGDQDVRGLHELLQHQPLMRRRLGEHGVQHDDHGDR